MTTKRTIYFNEDNHHYYGGHPPEDMTPEGLERLVEYYTQGTQVAGILFCVNVQRALFESKVWETFWSDYDPALGDDQPCIKRSHGIKNHLLLRERGIDQFVHWLAACKKRGVEGWLTMRMNDCHGLSEYARKEAGTLDADDWTVNWPSTYWREHPELRRAPYRLERSWEGAFDYGQDVVREHHLKLVREIFERWDFYGFEMDWVRWSVYFKPGHEQAGMPLLTEFVREVRRIADAAEKRVGHPIKLAHRFPSNPESCLALGFDPITWAADGNVDMATLTSFCGGADFAVPIRIWRSMLGPNATVNVCVEASAYPNPWAIVEEYEIMYGAAATALDHGADGVYLFNQNYRESGEPTLLTHMMTHFGDIDTVKDCRRRHPVTFPHIDAHGGPIRNVLPIPLRLPHIGMDFGRMQDNISVRIHSGPKPSVGRAILCLGFGGIDPAALENMTVRLNTALVEPTDEPHYESISTTHRPERHGWNNKFIDHVCFYELPLCSLFDGSNMIEIMPPQVDGDLTWAEIIFTGSNS
ncbi:MAG TPA: hypothetical protein VGK19_13305 [Capsulimonadaceae bacterium]|jgi:hypothetical protein